MKKQKRKLNSIKNLLKHEFDIKMLDFETYDEVDFKSISLKGYKMTQSLFHYFVVITLLKCREEYEILLWSNEINCVMMFEHK
jgi:hypothetical protein